MTFWPVEWNGTESVYKWCLFISTYFVPNKLILRTSCLSWQLTYFGCYEQRQRKLKTRSLLDLACKALKPLSGWVYVYNDSRKRTGFYLTFHVSPWYAGPRSHTDIYIPLAIPSTHTTWASITFDPKQDPYPPPKNGWTTRRSERQAAAVGRGGYGWERGGPQEQGRWGKKKK